MPEYVYWGKRLCPRIVMNQLVNRKLLMLCLFSPKLQM